MKQSVRNSFHGGMDKDSDPRLVAPGDYIDAVTIRNGSGAVENAASNMPGNESLGYTYPSGDNYVQLMLEDRQTSSLISFVHNTDAHHQILLTTADGVTTPLVQGVSLNFVRGWRPAGSVVDGKFLYWTDSNLDGLEFEGNPPRKINIPKANNYLKVLTYEIFGGIDGQGQFPPGRTYTFTVKDETGATLYTVTFTAPSGLTGKRKEGLEWLFGEIVDDTLSNYVDATNCDGHKLELEMGEIGWTLELSSSATPDDVALVSINHYPASIATRDFLYQLVKEPPTCAPRPTYIVAPAHAMAVGGDNLPQTNVVRDLCAQFRYRFIYDDNEKSAWSAISEIPINLDWFGNVQEGFNVIKLDLTDERLDDPDWLCILQSVEIAFRDGNENPFRLIERVPIWDMGLSGEQHYIFSNQKAATILASDDAGTEGTQVLKNQDYVPLGAGALAVASDENGDSRLFLGCTVEGYDCPDCVNVNYNVYNDVGDEDCLVDITGTVEILQSGFPGGPAVAFADYVAGGMVVYLAGTNYWAISNNPADGSGDGAFTIKNVPKGVYSLRVASYMCRFGNDMGPRYNLNNGLDWQRTSAPVIEVAGSLSATNGTWAERVIDLRSVSGTLDLDTASGYGTVKIQNAIFVGTGSDGDAEAIGLAELYYLDNNATHDTVQKRTGAIAIERQTIRLDASPSATPPVRTLWTDHNGYTWRVIQKTEFGTTFVSRAINPVAVVGQALQFYASYKGWASVYDDTAIAGQVISINSATHPISFTYFCYNTTAAFTSGFLKIISGKVLDNVGNGLANVLVWVHRNGRQERTNFEGKYNLSIWKPNEKAPTTGTLNTSRFDDVLWHVFEPDFCHANVPTPESYQVLPTATPWGNYEYGDIVYPFDGGLTFSNRYSKAGGRYAYALEYEDAAGRSCGAVKVFDLTIPYHTESLGYGRRVVDLYIYHQPPEWATRYRVLRTKESSYESYFQSAVADVKYAVVADGAATADFTTFGASNATHIFLRLNEVPVQDPTTTPLLVMFKSEQTNGYKSKYGDRVRYMLDETHSPVFTNSVLEVSVDGEYIDGTDYYVVIPYSEIFREIKPAWVFEFFTPASYVPDIYYSTGNCHEITSPGHGDRAHTGNVQNQDGNDPEVTPAVLHVVSGDTWWRNDLFGVGTGAATQVQLEHRTKLKTDTVGCEDIGRPFVVDEVAGMQRLYHNRIRFSGLYVPNSAINNLSSFGALDYQSINRQFGAIRSLAMLREVMLAVCQHKSQSIYVGKGRVLDLAGNISMGRSDQILNIANEIILDFGTMNPESIVVENGSCYGWDVRLGAVWRYGQDGMNNIGAKMIRYFRERGAERMPIPRAEDFAPGGFDRVNGWYLLSFEPRFEPFAVSTTLAYDESKNRWVTRLPYVPNAWGRIGLKLYTGRIEGLYVHGGGTVNTFFGVLANSEIMFPVNQGPGMVKDWWNIRVQTTGAVSCPVMTIPATPTYAEGMESQLLANKFVRSEGAQVADFLRDVNDTDGRFSATVIPDATIRRVTRLLRGRRLKGDILLITLRMESTSAQTIVTADVEYTPSMETKL